MIVPRLRFPEFATRGEWKEEELIKIAPTLLDGDWIESKDQSKSGFRLIQTGNIGIGEFILKKENARYISIETFGRLRCTEIFPGDCLISRLPDPIGRSCFVPNILERMITAVDCLIVRFDKQLVVPYLFILYSQTDKYFKEIKSLASGSTRERISKEHLSQVRIPITQLDEQQKIADCLSSLDELITAQNQQLEALKAHKKGLMQQLFPAEGETVPQLRFGEFRDSGEWEEDALGEKSIAFFVNEKMSLDGLELAYYVSTENLLPNYQGKSLSSKLPLSGSATRFKRKDILLSNIRPYLKKVWLAINDGGASNDVIVIRADSKIDAQFLSFLLKNDDFINYIMKGAEGVKMPRGDKDLIKLYRVTFPKKEEQQKIASCFSSLDELITAQTEKIAALKLHKQGLMQGLFPAANSYK